MSKVSIIIPVYNSVNYVEKCIRSVINQTWRDLEIIIVDDGSSDGSEKILDQLASEDDRIRLFHQKNEGVASARNKGLEAVTGEYLTFVDSDDYLASDYIEAFLDCMKQTGAEMAICGVTYVDENGAEIKKLIPDGYRRFEREEWTFRISAVWSHFYRLSLWEKYHMCFLTEERGEDVPISLFYSAVCDRITTMPKAGYFYVQHSTSAMHNFRGLRNYSLPYQALENVIKRIQHTGVSNSPEFYELFVLRILATCLFDLGRGASQAKMKELCDYIVRILETYFPDYYRNRKARLISDVRVPFSQKVAVWLLVWLVRTRLIYPASRLLSRNNGA